MSAHIRYAVHDIDWPELLLILLILYTTCTYCVRDPELSRWRLVGFTMSRDFVAKSCQCNFLIETHSSRHGAQSSYKHVYASLFLGLVRKYIIHLLTCFFIQDYCGYFGYHSNGPTYGRNSCV